MIHIACYNMLVACCNSNAFISHL